MLHQDMLEKVECPECSASNIEMVHWTDPNGASNYRATCECGFEHEQSYGAREIAVTMSKGGDGSYPMEYVHNGEQGGNWNAELRFSPRLFLEQAVQ